MRLQLGAEIEAPDRAELITRVADLEARVLQLLTERDARSTEADLAQRRARELEDDLTAARESLRRNQRSEPVTVVTDSTNPSPRTPTCLTCLTSLTARIPGEVWDSQDQVQISRAVSLLQQASTRQ